VTSLTTTTARVELFLTNEGRYGDEEGTAQSTVFETASSARSGIARRSSPNACSPTWRVRAHEVGKHLIAKLIDGPADTLGKRLIRVHDLFGPVADHDEIGERVERVLELSPRPATPR